MLPSVLVFVPWPLLKFALAGQEKDKQKPCKRKANDPKDAVPVAVGKKAGVVWRWHCV